MQTAGNSVISDDPSTPQRNTTAPKENPVPINEYSSKELLPTVRKAAEKSDVKGISAKRAALVFVSSKASSINLNQGGIVLGGTKGDIFWGYRESKAALNQAGRSFCKEVLPDGIGVLILGPGWVKTELGGQNADITPTHSVQGILKVIFSLNDKNNGQFLQYNGQVMPW